MKKTTTISLARTLFHIEEDAYALLDTYLTSVRSHFATHDDKDEILSDIEARMAERFSEDGNSIITITTVQSVIDAMGTIGQFDGANEYEQATPQARVFNKRLYRDEDTRVIAGVASGLGYYFGVDRTIIRILFIASVFLGGFGIIAYLILWIATPLAKTSAQKLEMRGEAVTLKAMSEIVRERFEEIDGERIAANAKDFGSEVERGARSFFSWIGPVIKTLVGIFVTIGGLFATAGFTVVTALALFRLPERFFGPSGTAVLRGGEYSVAVVATYLAIVLPMLVVLLWGISLFRKKSILNRINVLVFACMWFIALVVSGVTVSRLAYRVNEQMQNDPLIMQQTVALPLSPFTALSVADDKRVTVVAGEEYKIEYSGTQRAIDRTNALVENGILTISGDENPIASCMFCDTRPLEIVVTVPFLSAIKVTDSARVYADIETQTLSVEQSDASRLTLNGTATTLEVAATDASRFEGVSLVVKSARVTARDASRVEINADTILVVDAYNASRVEYSGSPQTKITKKDAARVQPIETLEEGV